MRKKTLTVLVVSLLAELTTQAAVASEHHHARTKGRPVADQQLLNSNAYAARGDIAVPSYWQNYDEGAMTSGIAGRWSAIYRREAPQRPISSSGVHLPVSPIRCFLGTWYTVDQANCGTLIRIVAWGIEHAINVTVWSTMRVKLIWIHDPLTPLAEFQSVRPSRHGALRKSVQAEQRDRVGSNAGPGDGGHMQVLVS
jgi:hypothetical protein